MVQDSRKRDANTRPIYYARNVPAGGDRGVDGNEDTRGIMRKWQCIVCGWIYDESEGCEEDGIPPGTAWEDVPEDFVCPECGVGKEDFEMIEIG